MTHTLFALYWARIFYVTLNTMSNKGIGSKKTHGFHEINQRRKKSGLGKRDNKAKARERRETLRAKGLQC